MKFFVRSAIFLLCFAGGVVVALWFFASREEIEPPLLTEPVPHFYKDPTRPIETIRLKLVYAVPKNKIADLYADWRSRLEETLDEVVRFHHLQFRGLSKIVYDIFPEPVILENDNIFYDTERTDFGNPKALIAVSEEIEKRLFQSGGDLTREDFREAGEGEYPVLGLLYEGVGAAGGVIYESELESPREIAARLGIPESVVYVVRITSVDGFFILNRKFLSQAPERKRGSTLLYHEFAHTLGLPDEYDIESDVPSTNDIMGAGRKKSIEVTYLERDTLRELGVLRAEEP